MTIRLYNIFADITEEAQSPRLSLQKEQTLTAKAAEFLGIRAADVKSLRVVRRAIDARHRPRFVYTLDVNLGDCERDLYENLPMHSARVLAQEEILEPTPGQEPLTGRPVVVGAGPAGLFAALTLARCGYRPLVLERGKPVAQRVADTARFHSERKLDPESNHLFGEGGAGTFSDGKLTTRIDDLRIAGVLATLVELAIKRPNSGRIACPFLISRSINSGNKAGACWKNCSTVVGDLPPNRTPASASWRSKASSGQPFGVGSYSSHSRSSDSVKPRLSAST